MVVEMGKGFAQEVAEGLTTFVPPSTQQMFIPGQARVNLWISDCAGAAVGLGNWDFMTGTPAWWSNRCRYWFLLINFQYLVNLEYH